MQKSSQFGSRTVLRCFAFAWCTTEFTNPFYPFILFAFQRAQRSVPFLSASAIPHLNDELEDLQRIYAKETTKRAHAASTLAKKKSQIEAVANAAISYQARIVNDMKQEGHHENNLADSRRRAQLFKSMRVLHWIHLHCIESNKVREVFCF